MPWIQVVQAPTPGRPCPPLLRTGLAAASPGVAGGSGLFVQDLGLYPASALGSLTGRNDVVSRDFSVLTPLRHRPWRGQRPRSLRSEAAGF